MEPNSDLNLASEPPRDSFECFREITQIVSEVFWTANPRRTQYFYVSPAYERIFGKSCQSLLDDPNSFLASVHPKDRARVAGTIAAAETDGKYEFEYRILRPDGTVRWIWDRAFSIRNNAGVVLRMGGVALDITDRKLTEGAMIEKSAVATLAAEIGKVLTAANSLSEIVNACVNVTADQLDAVTVALWTLNPQHTLELQAHTGDDVPATIAPGQGAIGQVAKSRQRLVASDVQRDAALRQEPWISSPDVFAFAACPLLVDSRLVGVLGLTLPEAISPFLATSLGSIADTIALGIHRKLAEQAHRKLEEQLNHSKKLEAVGKLAGGLAHDFNNMLTVISGCCQLIGERVPPSDGLHQYLDLIRKTGDRAATLTRQLLAFSRRQILEPKIVDLNRVAANMDQMLRRLIPENITLSTRLANTLRVVKVDPGQFELVIMNLVVNSRDAMPKGGRILIETANTVLTDEYCQLHADVIPGEYVMLAISDTGSGMDESVKGQIFEPFFTTKEQGKGTGLGLSTVYGIVKQSGGSIEVNSEVGIGTSFKIYLPATVGSPAASSPQIQSVTQADRHEKILLVEDDAAVRELVHAMLESNGFSVLVASNGFEALELIENRRDKVDLLLSDIVMPKMGGHELATRVLATDPRIKVLLTSGYSDTQVLLDPAGSPIHFLEKPFTPSALVRKVRDVLDGTCP